jgi:hypothetical protein
MAMWPQFLATVDRWTGGCSRLMPKVSTWRPPTESRNWQAAGDDASDIANKAVGLLHDPTAVQAGVTALELHHAIALISWESFLQLFS